MSCKRLTGAALLAAALWPAAGIAGNGNGEGEALPAATIAARTHYFGYDNVDQRTGRVDKDKVIVSWFGVASFALAARGHVVLLDSYIWRLANQPYFVPSTLQELLDLNPEAIFIGHGHGDHADNAAYISAKTGAQILAQPSIARHLQVTSIA